MKNEAIPRLRFKVFHDRWHKSKLNHLCFRIGDGLHGTPKYVLNGPVSFINGNNIHSGKIWAQNAKKVTNNQKSKDDYLLNNDTILMSINGTVGNLAYYQGQNIKLGKSAAYIIPEINRLNKYFLFHVLGYEKTLFYFKNSITGTTIKNLGLKALKSTPLFIPSLPEQQLIGKFFAKLDKLIQLQQKKVALLKKLKRGYLQKLFPRKGESVPRLRFKGFHGKWKLSTFKSILNYEQPTKYRVKNTHYSSSGIPVLTANKAFILGYTHEKHIYNKGNCIIFDDFTLDNKFVNFPFMIKSSAIKILTSKNSNLYFDYELLNVVHLIHEGHKRHYISMVQNFKILIPSLYEQDKIGNFFDDMDSHINSQRNKLTHLRKLKKAYLQKMFC